MIKIYTDGSCIGNPGKGGWAAIILNDGEKTKIKGRETNATIILLNVTRMSQSILPMYHTSISRLSHFCSINCCVPSASVQIAYQ